MLNQYSQGDENHLTKGFSLNIAVAIFMVMVADCGDVLLCLYMFMVAFGRAEGFVKRCFFVSLFSIVLLRGSPRVVLNSDVLNNMLNRHTLIIQKEKLDILAADSAFCFPVITMEAQKGKVV